MVKNKNLTTLTALSPIDGRYWDKNLALSAYFSEYALIRKRVEIELEYLVFLSQEGVAPKLSKTQKDKLLQYIDSFDINDANKVKDIEEKTNHDVKAVEYYIRGVLVGQNLEKHISFIHLFLTSDDINNVAYRLLTKSFIEEKLLPTLKELSQSMGHISKKYNDSPILARTHGQPAVPTTFGKEILVFQKRLEEQIKAIKKIDFSAKFGGAVGNWNANYISNSRTDWIALSKKFLKRLNLNHNEVTTQTAPPEDLICAFQAVQRVNSIVLDLDKDMWRYISDGWLIKSASKNEVGSSTMPQKVNPINFENSEGNIKIANSMFDAFTRELPVSRLQRDLSDSTVSRNFGIAFAHSMLAYKSTIKGLSSIKLNEKYTKEVLNKDWSILTEAAQTILRLSGEKEAYEIIAKKIKGKKLDKTGWKKLVRSLNIKKRDKQKLLNLTPETYLGLAKEIVNNNK